jgi:hypothetical protein
MANHPKVINVCEHDTMSAFLAAPDSKGQTRAVFSCGTMCLIGLQRDQYDTGDSGVYSRIQYDTGFGKTVNFKRTISGLWIYPKRSGRIMNAKAWGECML